ncbi:MAG: ATP-dependent protease ATPase subunit HslU [Myxococcales bacterium]|nr:ATP-dependent protease ATPase subunit HslU [Myxococcales bacterium]MCB9708985.1 ATP-dependent protease ATPase subunit HslU [Myxococcales bacterium]
MSLEPRNFTPREIVGELDRYIIGQQRAKRAVAVALRNRWRRQQVPPDLRDEIAPKNIIMIGPTGVGKTEIARRLAKLARAPFIKVEASKFTEVGYVGRDVESMIRDLVQLAVQMVRDEELEAVRTRAQENAEERLVRLIGGVNAPGKASGMPTAFGPFAVRPPEAQPALSQDRAEEIRKKLRAGEYNNASVKLDVPDQGALPMMTVMGGGGRDDMEMNLREMFSQLPGFGGRTKKREVQVPDAQKILETEEAQKLVEMDKVQRLAVERTEQTGIIFLDEIDKIAGRQLAGGPDVSREGVQRDLLPVVEGSTVNTKYGAVRTDHILFVAAGAFHVSKVSDLIPELQGRFPIRVELDSLEKQDFVRILTEPKNALTRQYEALLGTEGIELSFATDAIESIAHYAALANQRAENIGARRLHAVMEALLEELSFTAPERSDKRFHIDAHQVKTVLEPIMSDEDLARYIL